MPMPAVRHAGVPRLSATPRTFLPWNLVPFANTSDGAKGRVALSLRCKASQRRSTSFSRHASSPRWWWPLCWAPPQGGCSRAVLPHRAIEFVGRTCLPEYCVPSRRRPVKRACHFSTQPKRYRYEQGSSQGRRQGGRRQDSAEDRQSTWKRRPTSQGPCKEGPRQGAEEGRRREGSSEGREKQALIDVIGQAN